MSQVGTRIRIASQLACAGLPMPYLLYLATPLANTPNMGPKGSRLLPTPRAGT